MVAADRGAGAASDGDAYHATGDRVAGDAGCELASVDMDIYTAADIVQRVVRHLEGVRPAVVKHADAIAFKGIFHGVAGEDEAGVCDHELVNADIRASG